MGIIAEYNPFHNGHAHHLQEARRRTGILPAICVMSGNFTQRGDATILDKWTRAAIAVKGGVDLALELPAAFAVRSAQDFAEGGVRLLQELRIVSDLSFGAEDDDLALLKKAAALSVSTETIALLRVHLQSGKSYAAALTAAVNASSECLAKLMAKPNNILAIEYLKALQKHQNEIRPISIKRIVAQYHDTKLTNAIASATAIRAALRVPHPDWAALKRTIPALCWPLFIASSTKGSAPPHIGALESAIFAKLRVTPPRELEQILTISEGLENKLVRAALQSATLDELLDSTKSKRYPQSRLQRTLLHLLLHSQKETFRAFDATGPLYARVLAFNNRGRMLLKEIKSISRIPVITKTTDYLTSAQRGQEDLTPLQNMLAFDTRATDLYGLCFNEKQAGAQDFTRSPIYIN